MEAAAGDRAKLVVSGEGQKSSVVDGLVSFPAQHHGFLAVVLALVRTSTEPLEGGNVPCHERVQIAPLEELIVFAVAAGQHVGERLLQLPRRVREVDGVR